MIGVRRPTMVLVLSVLLLAVWMVPALAANRIHGVELVKRGGATVIQIAGERSPNFTTFKQDSPRRVIVDVAECDLGAVPKRIAGDGGLVQGVFTAQYGESPHGISRVIIALAREAEYRITTRGGSLYVHITPGQGGLLVSAGVPVAPERRNHRASGLEVPVGVSPSTVADAEHATSAPVLKNGPPDEEPRAVSVAMAKQVPDDHMDEPEPSRANGVDEATPEEVDMSMLPPPPLVIKTGPPDSEPGRVTLGNAKAAPEGVGNEPEPRSGAALGEEPAPQPVKVAMLSEAPRAQAPSMRVAQAEEATEDPAVEVGEEIPPPPAEETPPPPPPPEAVESGSDYSEVEEKVEIGGAIRDMTWVGFQQTMEASRVFIKTNEPVKFRVTEEGDNLIVLELENTRIPLRNNQRFLDTHFFNSAVTMITPQEIEGVSQNVRIEIQVRNRVPYTTGQEANMVYINFERPQ